MSWPRHLATGASHLFPFNGYADNMIHSNSINPLNVHGIRRITNCPPHFQPVYFDIRVKEKVIVDWIYEFLTGRFYVGSRSRDENGKTTILQCAAFEEHSEASYFSLMLTEINKPNIPF